MGKDGHHHQGEIKTAEMNTSGLGPPPATLGSAPLHDAAYQLLGDEDEDVAATEGTGSTGSLAAKLRELVRQKLAEVNASGAVVAGLGLVGSAVGAYFLWPAAAAAATAATMAAPGAAGFFISRAAFAANTKLYFQILRTAGAAAAAAAFAL